MGPCRGVGFGEFMPRNNELFLSTSVRVGVNLIACKVALKSPKYC